MRMHGRGMVVACLALALAQSGCSSATVGEAAAAAQGTEIQMIPTTTQVNSGATFAFASLVTGTVNTAVSWRVVEANGGTIDGTGLYQAPQPATTSQYHVEVASQADPTKTARATVTVPVLASGAKTATLKVQGRNLLDTCGNPLVVRGIEMDMYWAPSQASWADGIAATGANAMRLIVNHGDMTWQQVDDLMAKIVGHGMVFYWSIYTVPAGYGLTGYTDINYWNVPEVKALYAKYKKWIIVDAVQEYDGSEAQWLGYVTSRVNLLRSWGYDGPVNSMATMSGRGLPTLLNQGAAAQAADPLHNSMFNWQAYWFKTACGDGCCDAPPPHSRPSPSPAIRRGRAGGPTRASTGWGCARPSIAPPSNRCPSSSASSGLRRTPTCRDRSWTTWLRCSRRRLMAWVGSGGRGPRIRLPTSSRPRTTR